MAELTADMKNEPVSATKRGRGKKKIRPLSLLLRILVWGAAAITFFVLIFLVSYILIKGVPHLKLSLFEWKIGRAHV